MAALVDESRPLKPFRLDLFGVLRGFAPYPQSGELGSPSDRSVCLPCLPPFVPAMWAARVLGWMVAGPMFLVCIGWPGWAGGSHDPLAQAFPRHPPHHATCHSQEECDDWGDPDDSSDELGNPSVPDHDAAPPAPSPSDPGGPAELLLRSLGASSWAPQVGSLLGTFCARLGHHLLVTLSVVIDALGSHVFGELWASLVWLSAGVFGLIVALAIIPPALMTWWSIKNLFRTLWACLRATHRVTVGFGTSRRRHRHVRPLFRGGMAWTLSPRPLHGGVRAPLRDGPRCESSSEPRLGSSRRYGCSFIS